MEWLGGEELQKMVIVGSKLLGENKAIVDALNVFPVPDGDTGTNMYLTILSAAQEVQKLETITVDTVARASSMGSLMGARGNSGVILSQLYRGFAKCIEGKEKINSKDFARALQEGVDTAYKAVMKPVEGTILTVAREAAKGAQLVAKQGGDVISVLQAAIEYGEWALEKTPEMLPVLKQAGVVDAGGKGLIYIYQGALAALQGQMLPLEATKPAYIPEPFEAVSKDSEEMIVFQYCTELLLHGKGLPDEIIRSELAEHGDCVLVVGSSDLLKIHLHTNHPGAVLEYLLKFGELRRIKIDNMREQHMHSEFAGDENDGAGYRATGQTKALGIIAVAMGEGIVKIVKSLGVDYVIEGGQMMNPSTEDIVKAVNQVQAQKVIILPNNKNIILAAQQARELCNKEVAIVPTKSIPQGIAALLAFNPEADLATNQNMMTKACQEVKTGEVTFAVRNSKFNGIEIQQGDIIGIYNGEIKVVDKTPREVVIRLLQAIVEPTNELVTIFYGQEVSEEAAEALVADLQTIFTNCEIELQCGGQPLYYYIISVE